MLAELATRRLDTDWGDLPGYERLSIADLSCDTGTLLSAAHLCTGKRRRQFILSTHNAKIPVRGDAELMLGLTAEGRAARGKASVLPEHEGSIDTPSVCAMIEETLEGGRAAFERHRRKHGF